MPPLHSFRLTAERRGIATVWMLLVIPAILTLLVLVIEIGSLWLAQIELTNSLEAAALAGVKEWQLTSRPYLARNRSVLLGESNTVNGQPVILNTNGGGPPRNYNASTSGNIVIGAFGYDPTVPNGPLTFDPTQFHGGYQYGVQIQATVPVSSVFGSLFGISGGTYSVSKKAMAVLDIQGKNPHLVSGQTYITGTLSPEDFIWTTGTNNFIPTILFSSDRGVTWTVQGVLANVTYNGISFPTSSSGWAVGQFAVIMNTVNGGASWTIQTAPTLDSSTTLNDVSFATHLIGCFVGNIDNTSFAPVIYFTRDGGTTWQSQGSILPFSNFFGVAFAPYQYLLGPNNQLVWAVGDQCTIVHSTNSGATWTPQNTPGTLDPSFSTNLNDVFFSSPTNGWFVGNLDATYGSAVLYFTTDGGNTWTSQGGAPPLVNYHGVAFASDTVGWAVGDDGTILKSINGGQTWTPQTSGLEGSGIQLNDVAFDSTSVAWVVGTSGTILFTKDGGTTWSQQNSTTTEDLNSVAVGP